MLLISREESWFTEQRPGTKHSLDATPFVHSQPKLRKANKKYGLGASIRCLMYLWPILSSLWIPAWTKSFREFPWSAEKVDPKYSKHGFRDLLWLFHALQLAPTPKRSMRTFCRRRGNCDTRLALNKKQMVDKCSHEKDN